MDNALQTLLGIRWPIIQAPMAGVQGADLALAVSGAGGLGSLPCAMLGPDALRQELERITRQAGAPVNVNFFCHAPPVVDAAREAAWRDRLAPYYREFGIDATAIPAGPGRAPFSAQLADLLAEFKPAVVSFHFGLPSPELLARVRGWGARILSSATTVDEALWLEAQGVDAVIAQGLEAGGHRGIFLSDDLSTQLGTLALVPQIARKVRVPVIAAGGIADASGVAAAMALGAAGVQIGTAYLLCPEASTSAVHRTALKSAAARHTALTNLFTGRPARGIVNRLMRELGPMSSARPPEGAKARSPQGEGTPLSTARPPEGAKARSPRGEGNPLSTARPPEGAKARSPQGEGTPWSTAVPAFPLAGAALAPLRASAEARGSGDFSPLWSGQNASGCKEIPAAELTRELVRGL